MVALAPLLEYGQFFGNLGQIDSDRSLQGGVLPDTRVPITEETLKAIYLENRDVLLETAIEALQSR